MAVLVLAAIASLVPVQSANAAGNVRCATGQAKDGAYLCALTTVTASTDPKRPWLQKIELFIGGNKDTLEGGGCGEGGPSAAYVEQVWVVNPNAVGTFDYSTWGPGSGNLCQSRGYSKTWTMTERVRCNVHQVSAEVNLHDNGGADRWVHFVMDVETC